MLPQLRETRCAMTFRKALSIRCEEEGVMVVAGDRQLKQMLEEAVHMGGGPKIDAPYDIADPLGRIVNRNGEVIAYRCILAGKDDIAEAFRLCTDFLAVIGPI